MVERAHPRREPEPLGGWERQLRVEDDARRRELRARDQSLVALIVGVSRESLSVAPNERVLLEGLSNNVRTQSKRRDAPYTQQR